MKTTDTHGAEDQAARRERRERVVREHMDSENVQDWERTMATLGHPRYELVGHDRVIDGAEDVMDYWVEGRSIFPDQRNELIEIHHADGAVITEFWLRGTHLGGPRPTGRTFKTRMCAVFTFGDDDLITCERVYYDQNTINRQLRGELVVED